MFKMLITIILVLISQINAFNLFANQYPAANMMPMNSPQTYLLQNLLAQQSMQPKQNPLLSFINRAGMAANNPGQSRIAQLIFGPNQSVNPKPYAEKLETLSKRMQNSNGLSQNDKMRMMNLNKDLVKRLLEKSDDDEEHIKVNTHVTKRNETQELVDLITKIVDERLELYFNEKDQPAKEDHKVFIEQVEVKKKERQPRKIYVGFEPPAFNEIDSYYNEKMKETFGEGFGQKLSANKQEPNYEKQVEDQQSEREEEYRRQLKKMRKAEEKERKKHAKEAKEREEKKNSRFD